MTDCSKWAKPLAVLAVASLTACGSSSLNRYDGIHNMLLETSADATNPCTSTATAQSASAPVSGAAPAAKESAACTGYPRALNRFRMARDVAEKCEDNKILGSAPASNCATAVPQYLETGKQAVRMRCLRYFESLEQARVHRTATDNRIESTGNAAAVIKAALKASSRVVVGIWMLFDQAKGPKGWYGDFTDDSTQAIGLNSPELLYSKIKADFDTMDAFHAKNPVTSYSAATTQLIDYNFPCTPVGFRSKANLAVAPLK